MSMSNQDCIEILEQQISSMEELETFLVEDDDRDPEELRYLEREIEAFRRAVRALERTSKKRKKVPDGNTKD